MQGKPNAQQAAQQLADEMKRSGTAPVEQPGGIPREAYESENRHLKTTAVDNLLKKHGITWEDAQKYFTDQDWLDVFTEAKQNPPGYYSGNPAISKGQTLIKGGAPITKLTPKMATGGIVAPQREAIAAPKKGKKAGRMSKRGVWYGPRGSGPSIPHYKS